MTNDQLLLIFFRLLNFAVLMGIIVYFWKCYGRSYVIAAYEQEESELEGLRRTHTVLRQEERLLKKGYAADEQERALLKERLFAWREIIQKELDVRTLEKEERTTALQERLRQQINRVSEYRLYRELKDQAIEQVRERLQKQYASTQAQEEILSQMLKRLDVQ